MSYIKTEDLVVLDRDFSGWQQIAFENLRNSPLENANFYNEYKVSTVSGKLIFIACLNEDGIGSSRIQLLRELKTAFPNGYYIAMPDRSCGLIISKDISDEELIEVRQLVHTMYKEASTNMSDALLLPEDFTLPPNWLEPIDMDMSDYIINDIREAGS